MIYTLIMFLCLSKLKRDCPELFDGEAALRSINAQIAEIVGAAD